MLVAVYVDLCRSLVPFSKHHPAAGRRLRAGSLRGGGVRGEVGGSVLVVDELD
jgi:hypothetical protein